MHDTLTNVMGTSRQLITALEKSDWLDRLLIMSGLAFFLLVVLFILKQRIVDRGLRVAFWWTRFLPDFSGDAELITMEKNDVLASAVVVASSGLTAMSSMFTDIDRTVTPSLRVEESSVEGIIPGYSSISSLATPMPSLDLQTSTTDPGRHEEL
jgi:protein transport protein SEC20